MLKVYASTTELRKAYGIGRTCMYGIRREMEEEVRRGRYPADTVLDVGGRARINKAAFRDYMMHRRALKGKNTRKYVPDYIGG